MRVPLASYGAREIVFFLLLAAALAAAAALVEPPALQTALAAAGAALAVFTLWFFRDPHRRVPADPRSIVSPADGVVDDIEELAEFEYFGGPAVKIGIFLSPLNVHVNRMPLDGVVEVVRFQRGRFRPATDPRCAHVNERSFLGFRGEGAFTGRFALRQITGAVARRIVCPAQAGQRFRRGDRLGMIKFGSRTELYLPRAAGAIVHVQRGDRVKGAETVLAELPA